MVVKEPILQRNFILLAILLIVLNISIFFLIIAPPTLIRQKSVLLPPHSPDASSFIFQRSEYKKNKNAHGIFNPMFSRKFISAESKRYLTLYHFRFCNCLDDSLFDGMAHVYYINGSISTQNPYIDAMSKLIDEAAKNLTISIVSKFPHLNEWHLLRYACYTAAVGTSPALKLSKTPFIKDFHIRNFLKDIMPTLNMKDIAVGHMPTYQLAYLIYMPNEKAILNMKALVETLNDGNAVFMIQLDAKCGSLVDSPELLNWAKRSRNIFISTARYNDRWVIRKSSSSSH